MTPPSRPPAEPRESIPIALALAHAGVGRFRRALGRIASTGATLLLFASAATVGVVLHLDLPPTRRIIKSAVNQVLGTVLEGKIIADEIEHIGLDGVDIAGATVIDPRGGQVIRANHIRARADVLALVRDALLGDGDIVIAIPYIRLEQADVLIEMGPESRPTIEEAFTPIPSAKPTEPRAPEEPSRQVRVLMPHIEIGHAYAHGAIAPPRELDADVRQLVASVLIGPEGVSVDSQPVGIYDKSFLPAHTAGAAEYHLRVTDTPDGEDSIRMWMSFTGQVGSVEVLARGTIEDEYLTATADLPHATPDQLDTLIPGHPLKEPVTATVVMEGQIPRFDMTTRIQTHYSARHHAAAVAEGGLDATGPVQVRLDLDARDVDPRVFGDLYPDAQVNAHGSLYGLLSDGPPRLVVDAHSEPTKTSGTKVPAADVHVVLDRGVLSGTTHIYEPGMPIDGEFVLTPYDGLHFTARSDVANARAAPRLAGVVDGSGKVRASGTLKNGALDANVTATVHGFRAGDQFSLDHGQIRGRVTGQVDRLQVSAALTGSRARAGKYEFEEMTAEAHGPIGAPRLSTTLTDGQTGYVAADGVLDPRAGAVRNIKVKLEKDGTEVHGTIAKVGASRGGGGVALEGVALEGEGVGNLKGGLTVRGDDISGTLKGQDVDIAKVAKLVGVPYRVRGIANIDVDLTSGKNGRNGHVLVELANAETPFISGLSAHVAAKFKDDQVEADALVRLVGDEAPEMHPTPVEVGSIRCDGAIAQVHVSKGKGQIKGPLLSVKTWRDVTGRVELSADDWNLHCLSKLFPVGLPVSEVKGTMTTRFVVQRNEGERFPSLQDFYFRTHQLAVSGPQDLHDNEPEWSSTSTDLKVTGALDGTTGKTTATLTFYDGYVPPEISATIDLDLPALADKPDKRVESLRASPLTARLSVPRRSVSDFRAWPTFVHPYIPPLAGDVRIDGYVDGTVDEPFVTVRAIGWGVAHAKPGSREGSAWALPVDVDALATYDAKKATLDAHVSRAGREIASASAEIDADLHELIRGTTPAGKPAWTGGFYAKLDEVPLGEIPQLADTGIGGHVGGTISLASLNDKPTLKIELIAPDLKVGDDLYFEEGSVKLDIQRGADQKDRGILSAKFVGHDQGRLDATAYAGIVWEDGLIPTIDEEAPADLHARANKFRLAALHPLVASVLSKLDGELNGDVRIGWRRLSEGEKGSVIARMEVQGGVFHVPQIGQEFKNATVKIVTPDKPPPGYGVIRFDDIRAEGISGSVRGWGLARLDGLRFVDATGQLTVDEGAGKELPLTVEGVPLGYAHGSVAIQAEKHDRTVDVKLDIPRLHLSLPTSPSKNVQTLDEHPEIEVSHALGPEKEPRSADALRWVVVFDLGRLEVEGQNVEVVLRGVASSPPTVELTDKTRIIGDIQLVEGTIRLRGKEFKVERGLVRMRAEDASNPYLNVTAYWDAPDGSRIYVDYVGVLKPVTDDKLRFRSIPPRSEQEILAALILGSGFDQSPQGRAKGADASRATSTVAAGVLGGPSDQLNEVLAGTALHDFSTRIGTTEEGAVQTSLVVEVSESVTANYTYEQASAGAEGGPGGGASGQRSGRYQVGLDWRFHRNWVVRGSVGYDSGQPTSGVDLLYQYRY